MREFLERAVRAVISRAVRWAKREPARARAYAVAAIIAGAKIFDLELEEAQVTEVVALVLVILYGGERTRGEVTPARGSRARSRGGPDIFEPGS